MAENQTQPRDGGYQNPQGGPASADRTPEPRGDDRPVSDTEAAHAPEEGEALRDPRLGAPRPDPLTEGMQGGGSKDRREDYGGAMGVAGKGDALYEPPADTEDRIRAADARETTVRVEQNPGRDR